MSVAEPAPRSDFMSIAESTHIQNPTQSPRFTERSDEAPSQSTINEPSLEGFSNR